MSHSSLDSNLNFSYDAVLSVDKKWGGEESDGTWNGMIGMLMRDEADVAVSDFYITESRSKVITFSSALYIAK